MSLIKDDKMVSADSLKDRTNEILRSNKFTRDQRLALQVFVEQILHDHDAWAGYRSLCKDEVPEGELPGKNAIFGESTLNIKMDTLYKNTDNTRISYY